MSVMKGVEIYTVPSDGKGVTRGIGLAILFSLVLDSSLGSVATVFHDVVLMLRLIRRIPYRRIP